MKNPFNDNVQKFMDAGVIVGASFMVGWAILSAIKRRNDKTETAKAKTIINGIYS